MPLKEKVIVEEEKYRIIIGDNDNNFIWNYQNNKDTGSEYIPLTTSGKVYRKNEILDLSDDAAHVNMGGAWRMPTRNECEELLDNTLHKVETIDGVKVIFDDGFALIRASNTGPNITIRYEGKTEKRLKEIKDEFDNLLNKIKEQI